MAAAQGKNAPVALRDRKKLRQRAAMIDAAGQLFRDRGFEGTRMEDIASAAEVSVATVYNYFPTKQLILLEIVRANALSSQEPSAEILKNPPADPVDAIMALMKIETGDTLLGAIGVSLAGELTRGSRGWTSLRAPLIRALSLVDRPEIEARGTIGDMLRACAETRGLSCPRSTRGICSSPGLVIELV